MDRQFLGVSPYWGTEPGPIRFSAMRERPQHLARVIVPAMRGRPSPWLQPEHGYRSHNVDEVVITFDGGFTLDGELFDPAGPGAASRADGAARGALPAGRAMTTPAASLEAMVDRELDRPVPAGAHALAERLARALRRVRSARS